jgi:hypothetical protein
MQWLAKPTVAVAFGAFMLCTETCLHAETIFDIRSQWPDLPVHDWIAGGFLLGAGIVTRRDWTKRHYQVGAWAFMLSLLMASFFGHFAEWLMPPTDYHDFLSEGPFVAINGLLNVIAIGGLVATLRSRER